MDIELKPCPDCDGPAEVRSGACSVYARIFYVAGCANNCNFSDRDYSSQCTSQYSNGEDAAKAWNEGKHSKIRYQSFAGGRWTGD
jgi:hypothetical protein